MSHQTELIKKLQEIFQIDRADLDFGIYRILNSRSQEIGDYLQNKLPAKIQAAFSASGQTQIDGWKRELAEAEKAAADLGANPADLPKVKELKGKIAVAQKSGAAGEAAVYNHLLTFFSRYYEEGDFISQRRYKGDTYAVPYSGEEVLLHWANKDQYYTKSGENFSNYRFKLSDGREVFFRLTAADTAKDNRKDNDAARVFALAQERVIEKEDDNGDLYEEAVYPVREISDASGGKTLEIRFEYIVAPKGEKKPQEKANENTIATLKNLKDWQAVWQPAPTEKNPNRTAVGKATCRLHRQKHRRLFHPQRLGRLFAPRIGFLHQKRSDGLGQHPRCAHLRQHRRQPAPNPNPARHRQRNHRFPRPTGRFSEKAVAEKEIRCQKPLAHHAEPYSRRYAKNRVCQRQTARNMAKFFLQSMIYPPPMKIRIPLPNQTLI